MRHHEGRKRYYHQSGSTVQEAVFSAAKGGCFLEISHIAIESSGLTTLKPLKSPIDAFMKLSLRHTARLNLP
jgi:hypothetical protein